MKPAKVVSIIVLGRCSAPVFRDGIDKNHQEKLEAIYDQDLLGILPHHMVVRDSPDRWIVFDGLAICQLRRYYWRTNYSLYSTANIALSTQSVCPGMLQYK